MNRFQKSGKYSPDSKNKVDKEQVSQKRKTPWLIICGILVTCVVLGSVAWIVHYCANLTEASVTEPVIELTEPIQASTTATEPAAEETTAPVETTEPEETEPPVRQMLSKYQERYEQNPEFFGWLTVDGTRIDYPVMQSTDDNDEYLYADFDGDYYYAGIPFVDIKCSPDSDNLLIYGHNMNDGSMFHTLMRYEKESFWEEHPTIMFSDLYEDYEYEIVAAFRDRVYKKSDTCFKFYQFIDAENEEEFDYAVSQFKEKAIYDTGVDVEYGDKLVTLITCAYHVDNGRFVVIARRK